jgi:predicted aspartyl protease
VPSITGAVLRNGILIECSVGVSFPHEQALNRAGQPLPVKQPATFLVDTGADRTTVDERLMRALSLLPMTQTRVVTLKSGPNGHLVDTYAASLEIKNPGDAPWMSRTMRVLGDSFQGIDGIIGRDVLEHVHLEYNGPIKRYFIKY